MKLALLISLSALFQSARGGVPNGLAPKVMIISMFRDEAEVWYNIPEFNVLAQNISVPGLSPLFPNVHCTKDSSICQITVGEAEINAASSIAALIYSGRFTLTSTYFMIAGIAGVNPKVATIGSVTFARYAVQVGLQFEIDAREIPAHFSTGYFPQGSNAPGEFPGTLYGTEVFEVNDALRHLAAQFARRARLKDNTESKAVRTQYAKNPAFAAAAAAPTVALCDTATSDTFWSGNLLGEAFEGTTKVFTNGSAVYCTTQQEDNGTLTALMRGALAKRMDFSRIIIMRSASDFDRPPPAESALANLLGPAPGFESSVLNLHLAGVKVVEAIVTGWSATFERGIKATNYVGDIFGSLGGTPDFGPGSIFK
ncbi:purine nucleoside permease [Mycena albidolilacea]|uniref:Purine nucleoside permease n=1 Tax=Mycena albidolilacea TaxID=1033008 RepID=A0AAD7A2V1_9AGAR|nr:purine nucleoside permease [Mycena albidolilacea]